LLQYHHDAAPFYHCFRYLTPLLSLKNRQRQDILEFCATPDLLAPPLLSAATLGALAAHIVEICQEWRWL